MSANVINGTDLCLFITSGATKKCIALASSCKISTSMSTRKIGTKDSGIFEESAAGRISWTCDSDNLFTQDSISGYTYDSLMDLHLSRTSVVITFGTTTTSGMGYPQTIGTGKTLTGTVWISKVDLNAKDNDNSSFTVSMEGTGPLTHA